MSGRAILTVYRYESETHTHVLMLSIIIFLDVSESIAKAV